jgi:hypothetical protein
MDGALDESAFEIQELLRLPLQRGTRVGAAIEVAVHPLSKAHHEEPSTP